MLYMDNRKTRLSLRGTDGNYSPPMRKVSAPAQGGQLCERQERSNLGVVADDRGSQGRPGAGKTLVAKILMSSNKWSQHTTCMHWQAEK